MNIIKWWLSMSGMAAGFWCMLCYGAERRARQLEEVQQRRAALHVVRDRPYDWEDDE